MYEMILQENKLDLKSLEKYFFKKACKAACEEMKELLEKLDNQIEKDRDKELYRHKGGRKTSLKTLMGEVEFSRTVYKVMDGSPEVKHVFLLDEYLGFDCIGQMTGNLAQIAVGNACNVSFRDAARNVSELTGQVISHGGVWNIAQKLGERLEEIENQDKELHESERSRGTREVDVLFEEADGVNIRMQGKDRKKGKKQEMKVAIFYEGWKKTGKKRYELHNKQVVCGFETAKDFAKRKEAKIASIYNTDEIKKRLYNSDGATGIKDMADEEAVRNLDSFHVGQAIIRATPYREIQKDISRLYRNCQTEEMLNTIDAYANSMEDEKQEKKLRNLYGYLSENKKDLIPYLKRDLNLPEAPEGLEYRGMGACEHNVDIVIARRMKHRGACWSRRGANNLGKVLALKVSNGLSQLLEAVVKVALPEKAKEEIVTILSSGKVPQSEGKGYTGKVSPRPFAGAAKTNGRRAIDGMFDLREFTGIPYM